jgi:hypothetical protein
MTNARRSRFVAYFAGKPFWGDRGKLIAKTGYSKGRIAQLFDEDQAFGERAARSLAERLGLDPDYFERDFGATTNAPAARSPLAELAAEMISELSVADQRRAYAVLVSSINRWQQEQNLPTSVDDEAPRLGPPPNVKPARHR